MPSSESRHPKHPLGPVVESYRPKHPAKARAVALVAGLAGLALLAVARTLTPADAGIGTHQQLGLPPCSAMRILGIPCPTCGMTTAFSHTVRAQFAAAFLAQPAGMLFAVATFLLSWIALFAAISGRMWRINPYRVSAVHLIWTIVAILLFGWTIKLIRTMY